MSEQQFEYIVVGGGTAGAVVAAAGRGFMVSRAGRRVAGGIVTTLGEMRTPTPCVQLYPVLPLTADGHFLASIGRARSEEELGDAPWKVMVEEGLDLVFEPRVPKALVDYLTSSRKADTKG